MSTVFYLRMHTLYLLRLFLSFIPASHTSPKHIYTSFISETTRVNIKRKVDKPDQGNNLLESRKISQELNLNKSRHLFFPMQNTMTSFTIKGWKTFLNRFFTLSPMQSWSIRMTDAPLLYDIASNISSTSAGWPTLTWQTV